jgi:hypothetical protein
MMSYIWHLIANIGYFLLFVNLVLFSIRLGTHGKANKIFMVYLLVILVIQLVSAYLSSLRIYNLFLSHFYFVGQFILLSLFYKSLFKNHLQKKIINIGFVCCVVILGIQYGLEPNLFFSFNLFEIFITSFLLIVYGVFHFYNMLTDKKEFYYINMGILFYLFGSTILFLVGNFIVNMSGNWNKITWVTNSFLYVIYQLFIMFEWYKSFYKKPIQLKKTNN